MSIYYIFSKKMTQQAQISENLFEPIEPPKVSEDLLPVLSDVLQPPPVNK